MNRDVLIKGIEIVGVLFAAFGGFLAGIAPPEEADARFAVGISSFLALIILFIVAALSKKKYRGAWILTAACLFVIAVGAAYYYKTTYDDLTFEYPPGSHVAGTELTPEAREYKQRHEGLSNAQLLARFGGLPNKGKVWPEASVNSVRAKLIISYVVLVLAIASAVFALTEGVLRSTSITRGGQAGHSKAGGEPRKRTGSRQQEKKDTGSPKQGKANAAERNSNVDAADVNVDDGIARSLDSHNA
jgi:hypothetical protein